MNSLRFYRNSSAVDLLLTVLGIFTSNPLFFTPCAVESQNCPIFEANAQIVFWQPKLREMFFK